MTLTAGWLARARNCTLFAQLKMVQCLTMVKHWTTSLLLGPYTIVPHCGFVVVLEVEPKKQVAMNEVQPTNFQVHDL